MTNEITQTITAEMKPQQLRRELQEGRSDDLWRRRAIIGLSLLGAAAMTAVSLFQTGVVKHLPDPPIEGFDSDKVNSSDTAYMLGVPDGTVSLASLAANIPLAAWAARTAQRSNPSCRFSSRVKRQWKLPSPDGTSTRCLQKRRLGAATASRARSVTSASSR